MRLFIFLMISLISMYTGAQDSYWKYSVSLSGEKTPTIVELSFTKGKYRMLQTRAGGEKVYFIADSSANKAISYDSSSPEVTVYFMEEDDASYEDESYSLQYVQGIDYKLLSEKRILHGIPCQKIELFERGAGSYGWVALGVFFHLDPTIALSETDKGTIIEYIEFDLDGSERMNVKFLEYDNHPRLPAGIFSIATPKGYKVASYNE